ncbi:MAG: acetyl-CoA carboxylase biotin carboxylase subunit [Planctomycetota bacterium]|jgi:3-methylcrotonyl-CoA carboxylase alpha subunit
MFKKVLIANRGEIACRVAQTLQEMGIIATTVYSDPDRLSLHVANSDEAYPLSGVTATDTYLCIDKIMDVARACGADAIHPGYGFLSENAEFATACSDAGITFIGPTPECIAGMGDKITAKEMMEQAGVPIVPGWSGDAGASAKDIAHAAESIGFPILVKAAAGGGGKGMRVVRDASELAAAVEAAGREAKAAFGDARVFLEKFIERPRHVEFQIFGDHHGNAVHLFERECSLQRRHQKIIEEAVSPVVSQDLRDRMGTAAVKAARAIGYANAGTVEFMLDDNGDFYFLEVNARLQVEHPVTELVTSHDLVRAQLEVASGQPIGFDPAQLRFEGHAIECRIYAEDPYAGFIPSVGTIAHFVPPVGANVRVDTGVQQGSEVSVHYDPMLAKLIVWGNNRPSAIRRMRWALKRFAVVGVTTNIEFLQDLLNAEFFEKAEFHTQLLDEHPPSAHKKGVSDAALIAAAAAISAGAGRRPGSHQTTTTQADSPWTGGGAWRMA